MYTLLIFLAVLSTLVLIHELGHFLAARFFGVKAEEFGFGFPPRALGFVKDKGRWKRVKNSDTKEYASTIWSINWLPLGGFVRMKGEDEGKHDSDSFVSKPIYARGIILAAGVIMNWLLACFILTVSLLIGVRGDISSAPSYAQVSDRGIELVNLLPDSAASEAGLRLGDRVTSVNGIAVQTVEQAQFAIKEQSTLTEVLQLNVLRDAGTQSISVTPRLVKDLGHKGIGVALAETGIVRLSWYRAVPEGIALTARYTWMIVAGFGELIQNLVVGKSVGADVSGPVGIAVMTGRIAAQGILPLLQFAALLSLNLAVVNFLPIPALDGGRFLFLLIEAIRGRKSSERFEANLHRFGFIFLIGLIVLVTVRDLGQYGGMILQGLRHLI